MKLEKQENLIFSEYSVDNMEYSRGIYENNFKISKAKIYYIKTTYKKDK